jgi:hypothetical protein
MSASTASTAAAANRAGLRDGEVSEFTVIVPMKEGGAAKLRAILAAQEDRGCVTGSRAPQQTSALCSVGSRVRQARYVDGRGHHIRGSGCPRDSGIFSGVLSNGFPRRDGCTRFQRRRHRREFSGTLGPAIRHWRHPYRSHAPLNNQRHLPSQP